MLGRWAALWLVIAFMVAQGCTKDGAEVPTPESTSGGEDTAQQDEVFEDDPAIATGPADHPSPWGATRAEQCRALERKELNRKARSSIDEGIRLAAGNQVGAAQSAFENALRKDESAYPAAYNLGVLADRQGKESEALKQYRRALRIQPDYEKAVRGIITIEVRRDKVSSAIQTVEPIAREHPTNLDLQAAYAEVLVRARRYDEAWQAARQALRCDERFVPALIALVKVSLAQGREELADSILDQALEIDQKNAELHFLKGERLKEEPGRLRESMGEYRKAVELRPDYAEARIALGVQMLNGGNYREALSHFEVAKNLVPMLAEVHVNLGDAYRANKKWTEAQRAYEKAISIRRDMPEALFGLGLLYMSAGAEFPGLDELTALQKSVDAFTAYRDKMGPRLGRDDRAKQYLADLERQIKRTKRRIERDKRRAQEAAQSSEGTE